MATAKPKPAPATADGLAPTRAHEGLFRCVCGSVVAKDRQGHKVTPCLGYPHQCPGKEGGQTQDETEA